MIKNNIVVIHIDTFKREYFASWVLGQKLKKEGFHNLTPGIYPMSDTKGLLYPTYQMKNNPGLSDLDMQRAYKLYPSYAVGSYAQRAECVEVS